MRYWLVFPLALFLLSPLWLGQYDPNWRDGFTTADGGTPIPPHHADGGTPIPPHHADGGTPIPPH